MSAKSIELADAIVAALNRAPEGDESEFVFAFEAKRKAAPMTLAELQELQDLRVTVFTGSTKSFRADRGRFGKTYKPVIAIQRKLDGLTDEANLALADDLMRLEEQIAERLEDEDLVELSFVGFNDEQDAEQYNAEAMQAIGLFMHVMTLEYTTG